MTPCSERLAFALAAVVLVLTMPHACRASQGRGRGNSPNTGPGGPGNSQLFRGLADPGQRLRELSTARAQITEEPFTLAKGTWSGEVELVAGSHDVLDSLRSRSLSVAPVRAGYGLADRLELEAGVTSFSADESRNTASGLVERSTGFGGASARLKTCWIGTDSSAWAAGAAAFVHQASAPPGAGAPPLEGGVLLPVSVALPGEVRLGAMAQLDWRDDDNGTSRHREWLESISLSREILTRVSGFAELVRVDSQSATAGGLTAVDAGIYWEMARHWSLGAGGTVGFANGSTDSGLFGGVSWHL